MGHREAVATTMVEFEAAIKRKIGKRLSISNCNTLRKSDQKRSNIFYD